MPSASSAKMSSERMISARFAGQSTVAVMEPLEIRVRDVNCQRLWADDIAASPKVRLSDTNLAEHGVIPPDARSEETYELL
jgi:hypothetical protein